MATPRPKRKAYFNRSVLPTGQGQAAVGIPAEVRRDLDLQPGKDGDVVDLQYDRDEGTLTVFFADDSE